MLLPAFLNEFNITSKFIHTHVCTHTHACIHSTFELLVYFHDLIYQVEFYTCIYSMQMASSCECQDLLSPKVNIDLGVNFVNIYLSR